MQDVTQTKVRLIREAIQDNLPRGPHRKIRNPEIGIALGRSRRFPIWVPVLSVAMIFAYVVSGAVVSRTDSDLPILSNGLSVVPAPVPAPELEPVHATDPAPAPRVTEAASEKPPRPLNRAMFPLSVKKIIIDPGHGGVQAGTISQSGVAEKDITLAIALQLRRLLLDDYFEVLMTRETDQTLPLDQRADFANANHADLFISIHINSMPVHQLRPLETYFLGPTDDPEATKLAALENHGSGFSLSDYRYLLEKTYMDTRRDESRRLANAVQKDLYRAVHQINPAIENRGVKTAPFAVLIRTDMPAILVEVSCLSNEDEVKLLTNEEYRENIAQALLTGIRSYANDLKGSEGKIAKNGTDE